MILNEDQLKRLADEAIATAKSASILVSTFDCASLVVQDKSTGTSQASLVVTQLDIAVEEHIKLQLKAVSEEFDIAWLAEESAQMTELKSHDRFHKDYFWCVDPLDGTLPFIENTDGYSISIALVSKDGTALIGIVANPVTMDIYHWNLSKQRSLTAAYFDAN